MTAIQRYPFVDGEPIYVVNSEGTYNADEVQFESEGVTLIRVGIDRVFVPYCNIIRVYQTIDAAASASAAPNTLREPM